MLAYTHEFLSSISECFEVFALLWRNVKAYCSLGIREEIVADAGACAEVWALRLLCKLSEA